MTFLPANMNQTLSSYPLQRRGVGASWGLGVLACLLVCAAGCERVRVTGAAADDKLVAEYREALTSGAEEGEGTKQEEKKGEGWANLTGTFLLDDGAPIPKPAFLNITKDQAVCQPGGAEVRAGTLVVDPASRGIKNIVVFLRKASREHESVSAESGDALFDQERCIFLSHVFAVRLGRTLEIKNSDPVAHNTNYSRSGMRGQPFNATIPDGKSVTFAPTAEENQPVDVTCSIHPWMKAYILPRANGYFAVTKEDGSFEIPNLPAGEELEFQVWHERGSGTAGALSATTPDIKWAKNGRFKIELTKDGTRDLPVVVPASSFN